jgi:NADPH:quinone reductase-like Zn-dependent oxidoreductase
LSSCLMRLSRAAHPERMLRGRACHRKERRARDASASGRIGGVKAAYIDGFCDAGGIRYGDLPDPLPAPGQVLVRVTAVAVNTVDTLVRSGSWRTSVGFPLVVGRDLAGTVAAARAGVSEVRPGDLVWANSAATAGFPRPRPRAAGAR